MQAPRTILKAFLFLFLFIPAILPAESVFINDGSIIEGVIENKGPDSLTLQKENRLKVEIPNAIILRVTGDESYKNRMSVKLKSGISITGHIVEKSAERCVIRKVLTEMDETNVPLGDIAEITPFQEPSSIAGASEEKRESPGVRAIDPKRAARLSALPIYSGSFLVKSNWPGIAFVGVKTCSFLLPFTIVASNFLSGSVPGSASESGSSGDSDILKNNDQLRMATYISAAIWVLATAGDMYYSYRYVSDYNRGLSGGRAGSVNFYFSQYSGSRVSFSDSEERAPAREWVTEVGVSFLF